MSNDKQTDAARVGRGGLVRHLPDNATCHECGHRAGDWAHIEKLDDIGATERVNIVEWSDWENGKTLLRCEPEHFPVDASGDEWETCGNCGCARWNLPNTFDEPIPATIKPKKAD